MRNIHIQVRDILKSVIIINQQFAFLLIIPVASGWAYDPFRKYILLVVSDRPLKPYEKTKYRLNIFNIYFEKYCSLPCRCLSFRGTILSKFRASLFSETGSRRKLGALSYSPLPLPFVPNEKYILVMDSGVHKFPSTPQPIKIAHLFSLIQSGSLVRTELSVYVQCQ